MNGELELCIGLGWDSRLTEFIDIVFSKSMTKIEEPRLMPRFL